MASPQKDNGFTQIANELLEALARLPLNPNEGRILWVILRKTYGWNKKADLIALTDFQNQTGLERKSVCRSLKSLVFRNIIEASLLGSRKAYKLQKNYEIWKGLASVSGDTSASVSGDTPLVSAATPELVSAPLDLGVSAATPSKEINTIKERGFFEESYPQAVENQIVDLRNVGWSDPRIKDHFLMRNIPDLIVQKAFKNITEREAQNAQT